ncbi:major tail protein [Siminovitchia terrae]|nr:major tail protein [Siminovitchia terrae]
MAAEKKKTGGTIGIDKFYYAIQTVDTEETVSYGEKVRVPYAQSVNIETEQEIAKAYGDNKVAEMAVSTGSTSLEMQFHAIPIEDRVALLGLEQDEDGLVIQRSQTNPPYVAVCLEKTTTDGAELLGLTKGMFMLPATEAQTKEDSLEFGSDTLSGEFAGRTYDDAAIVRIRVGKSDDAKRQKFEKMVFNPAGTVPEGV